MPLDAICLAAVRDELAGQIQGKRIEKIQQPERDLIILTLRGGVGESCRLLISAGTADARVHLTACKFDNPAKPPMFCMLLRKYITGARIISIFQPQSERILELVLETSGAIGDISEKHLIVEMIGRMSNIILKESNGVIVDCLRRVGGELDSKRLVLPGLYYVYPPAQEGKADPLSITAGEWQKLFDRKSQTTGSGTVDKQLLLMFTALSPLICREITWRAYGDVDCRTDEINDKGAALFREFFSLIEQVKKGGYEPWLIKVNDKELFDYSYTHIRQYGNAFSSEREVSFSEMLDSFYTRTQQQRSIHRRAAAVLKTVKTARDRVVRKLTVQQVELKETKKRDYLRECGDIIMANLHLSEKGVSSLTAPDFYSEEGGSREIKLDLNKTPQQNAAKYYKAYSKAKNAEKYLTEQIISGENELEYLDSVLEQFSRAESEQDINEIRNELQQTGYVRAQKRSKPGKASEKAPESTPKRFLSSNGLLIQAGRNNNQNDKLTMKTAKKTDVWLHAHKAHGAHVILSCEGSAPDETSLYEAAVIAAYYSAARSGGKVPVDHTLVKYIKKPPGARPGMVIYTEYKSITASPDEELIKRLSDSDK